MVLQIEHLTKVYRNGVRANDDVSLGVAAGEVVGLLGHNGAGKTTLLNQVIGLTRPTSGSVSIDGVDVIANPAQARQDCSLQPQSHAPLDGVTPRQAIEIMARLRGATASRGPPTHGGADRGPTAAAMGGHGRAASVRRCPPADGVLPGRGRTGPRGHARRADQRCRSGAATTALAAGPGPGRRRLRGPHGHPRRGRGRARRGPARRFSIVDGSWPREPRPHSGTATTTGSGWSCSAWPTPRRPRSAHRSRSPRRQRWPATG